MSLALDAYSSRAATALRGPAMAAIPARKGSDTTDAVAVWANPCTTARVCAGLSAGGRSHGRGARSRGGDPLGRLLAVKGTAANAQERTQLRSLAQDLPHGTADTLTPACVALGKRQRWTRNLAARNNAMHRPHYCVNPVKSSLPIGAAMTCGGQNDAKHTVATPHVGRTPLPSV